MTGTLVRSSTAAGDTVSSAFRLPLPLALALAIAPALALPEPAAADPHPPLWGGGNGAAVHFPPVPWPDDSRFVPYTRGGDSIRDQRNQDPSNGGTAPQNYVNVSSACSDGALPSVYVAYDSATKTLFFRWRVEQRANTYATGPSAGTYSASDPWNSALWTVLIDVDGDGFREFAVQLDGGSGRPAEAVDRMMATYSDTRSQSVDHVNDPNVRLIAHNPTAFVDDATGRILNVREAVDPVATWPDGAAAKVWDYGTTRCRDVTVSGCTEFLVDYQIPLAMLDATAFGGPKVTENTPISLLFATANSNTNPFQKDVVASGNFVCGADSPGPFSDFMTPDGGRVDRPSSRPSGRRPARRRCGRASSTSSPSRRAASPSRPSWPSTSSRTSTRTATGSPTTARRGSSWRRAPERATPASSRRPGTRRRSPRASTSSACRPSTTRP